MTILIVGFQEDSHGDAVAWALEQRGISAHVLHYSDFPRERSLSVAIGASETGGDLLTIVNNNQRSSITIDCSDITAIWLRRPNLSTFDTQGVHEHDLNFVVGECKAFCAGLIVNLPKHARWINPVESHYAAASKARQLTLAAKSGLKVPVTLMSNDPPTIRSFISRQEDGAIFKPFHPGFWNESGRSLVQYTIPITAEMLQVDQAIQMSPGIYQQQIRKKFEIRANVFGDRIISAKIDSQALQDTKSDWRVDLSNRVSIAPFTLPLEIERNILDFMRRMNLTFGCIDLICDENGDFIFLEINEQGQFLWIEERNPEVKVLAEFCAFLCREAGVAQPLEDWPSLDDYLKSDSAERTASLYAELDSRTAARL